MARRSRGTKAKASGRRAAATRRPKADIFDTAIAARSGSKRAAAQLAAAERTAARKAAQLAAREAREQERTERRLQREAHRADLRRQRKAEAAERKRKSAAKAKRIAKERKALRKSVTKARTNLRRKNAPALRTPADALLAIGALLGASTRIDASPVSGRFVTWKAVARYDLDGIGYAELQPLLAAISADPTIERALGARTLARIKLEYTGRRSKRDRSTETREWTAGDISSWSVCSERAERAVDQAAHGGGGGRGGGGGGGGGDAGGGYDDTEVNWMEVWVAEDEADDTGEFTDDDE